MAQHSELKTILPSQSHFYLTVTCFVLCCVWVRASNRSISIDTRFGQFQLVISFMSRHNTFLVSRNICHSPCCTCRFFFRRREEKKSSYCVISIRIFHWHGSYHSDITCIEHAVVPRGNPFLQHIYMHKHKHKHMHIEYVCTEMDSLFLLSTFCSFKYLNFICYRFRISCQ